MNRSQIEKISKALADKTRLQIYEHIASHEGVHCCALVDMRGVTPATVSHHLKVLSAAGLVEVRQGDSTTVRDFRRHAGLDLLPRLLLRGGEVDLGVARSVLEARLHNGPKVAELAARRRRPELAALLDDSVRRLEAEDDPIGRQRCALTFWDHVVDGAPLDGGVARVTPSKSVPGALVAVPAPIAGLPAFRW